MSADTHRLLPTLSPSFLVSSSISIRRPASTTVKPAFISASEAARPTPVPAPVTIAILLIASAIVSSPSVFCFCFGFVGWSWNILMCGAQGRRPARAQVVEIGLAGLDAMVQIGLAGIRAHHQHVDRQAHAEIGAHGRIHRDQAGLQRLIQFDVVMHRAVEHRLAVFVLADLQVRRVGGAFDEIAGGVDHEQPHPRALDLAAEQEGDVEGDVFGSQRRAFGGMDQADRPPDALCRLEHGRRVHQCLAISQSVLSTLTEGIEDPDTGDVDSTDWLIARFPALAIAMMRSPGFEKIWSLRKVETLSRPALVRVSAIMTSPSRTRIPQQ